jgi:hypothetical protein
MWGLVHGLLHKRSTAASERPLHFIAIRRSIERIERARMRHVWAGRNSGGYRMRQTVLAAAAAFVIGGIATGAVLSQAQPAPPPAQQLDGAAQGGAQGAAQGAAPGGAMAENHWAGGWGHHRGPMGGPGGRPWMHREGMRRAEGLRKFGLIYRHADRQLAPADVQKIAEAFLLWNGNHTWKVGDVAATPEGPIAFSLTTSDGSVVAKFTMDPHTGKIARIG